MITSHCNHGANGLARSIVDPSTVSHLPSRSRTRTESPSNTLKSSTGITGLEVHPDPLPALAATYKSTLNLLSTIPSSSVYRQATEAITKHRLSLVEGANGNITAVEKELGRQVEETLVEAKDEETLAGKMIEWKA